MCVYIHTHIYVSYIWHTYISYVWHIWYIWYYIYDRFKNTTDLKLGHDHQQGHHILCLPYQDILEYKGTISSGVSQ